MIDQSSVAEFERHDHDDSEHLGFHLCVSVALDQSREGISTRLQVRAPTCELRLRKQQVGIESNGRILIGSAGESTARLQKGFTITGRFVQT